MGLYSKCRKMCSLISKGEVVKAAGDYVERKREQKNMSRIVRNHLLVSEEELEGQRKASGKYKPLISIVTPLYNTPKEFLEQLLESVLAQSYMNWELCLADGSDKEHSYVGEICTRYAQKDRRFKYRKLSENEGIVGNTNQCIEMSSGEYIGLLDHDDLLHPAALFEVMEEMCKGADFVYTDELKFQGTAEDSTDIVCKNGFGKDELRSHNYICHFVAFDKSLLDGMDVLYRRECEGSQDYDMVLRLTEKAQKIVHIPRILYYWRVHQASVSMNLSVKQYAVDAAKKAITSQLERSQETGKVECNYPYETIYKVNYAIDSLPLVSIFLWGSLENEELVIYLQRLIESTHYQALEILVSKKVRLTHIAGLPVKVVPSSRENPYEWFCQADACAEGVFNLYLSDCCMPENEMWIEEMLMFAQRKDVGVVGPHIRYRDNRTYFAGAVLDKDTESGLHVVNYNIEESDQGYEANMRHVRNTTVLSSLCMMISSETLCKLGGFQTAMDSCADADLCLRCKEKGYWNVWTCFAVVYYKQPENEVCHWNKCQMFWDTWKNAILCGDEYYPPLLKELGKI